MSASSKARVAVAFVCGLVPDEPGYHGPAFNRAGQMFQHELAEGLSRQGLDVTLLSVRPVAATSGAPWFVRSGRATSASGRTIRLLPFINRHPFKPLTAGASTLVALLAWAIRHRGQPRLIHSVNLTMPPGLSIWLAAKLSRSKVSASLLDVWKPGALVPDTTERRLDFKQHRFLLPRLDGRMVVSRAVADELSPGRHFCLLEGGIVASRFAQPRPMRPPRAGAPFRVVLSGSLTRFNGVDLALDAFERLPDGFELIVAGMGPRAAAVEAAAARDPRITYLGFITFDEVLEAYRGADLVLNLRLTQEADTGYFFPSKLMELLASGTPVLSTRTGTVEAEYGHVLYLLDHETPEAVASRIAALAAVPDDERLAMGERARAFMLAEKTWDRQTEKLAHYLRAEVVGIP